MLGLDDVVLDVRVEAVVVELIKIGRVEDRHVDVAGAEQVVDQHLFAISAKLFEGPHLLRRAEAAVKGVKAFDPALPVFVFPILGVGVPEMHVAIDDKDVVPVMLVHAFLLYFAGPDGPAASRRCTLSKARQKDPLASSATRTVRAAS